MTYEECRKLYGTTRTERIAHARSLGTHTKLEWEGLKAITNFLCVKCESEIVDNAPTKDHIIPIYMGGSDSIDNIQPLCRQCNSGKNDCTDHRPPRWKAMLKRWLNNNF